MSFLLTTGERQGVQRNADHVLRRQVGGAQAHHQQHRLGGPMDPYRSPIPESPVGPQHLHLRPGANVMKKFTAVSYDFS
jgi:hypothetical protein